ncbi:MAG: response regulator, partial [Anaerohalosphaera sp.]|nr:response regulator [Anaerohalosphaera sp.]
MSNENNNSIGRQILVVDDAPPNQMLLMLLLQKMGHHVTIANNGKEAVEMASQNNYDLIFMDMHMPIMNGFDATRELRSLNISTPIVALTASILQSDIESTYDYGCNDYMAKPIDRKLLKKIVNKYLPTRPDQYAEKIDALKQQTELLSGICSIDDDTPSSGENVNPAEIIDLEDAMKFCGDETAIKRIAASIVADGSQTVKMMESSIKAENTKDLLLAAHRLRGICLLIGAKKLAISAEKIEDQASTGSV